jgi:hypothetical protein
MRAGGAGMEEGAAMLHSRLQTSVYTLVVLF